jgi:hypothetical protein
VAELFADVFLHADPHGAAPVPRHAMLAALPQRERSFAAAGLGRARLDSATETALDDHYVLLRTHWSAPSTVPDGGSGPLALDSTFLLRRDNSRLSVVVHLNHADIAAVLAGRSGQPT